MVWLPAEACWRGPRGPKRAPAPRGKQAPPRKRGARFAEISCAATEISTAVAAARAFRRKGPLQPLRQILAVIAPHHFIADAIGQLVDARLQRRAPLRRRIRA